MAYGDQNRGGGTHQNRDEGRRPGSTPPVSTDWTKDFSTAWIRDRLTEESIVFAEKFGRHLKENGFTTSQIRNVFGEIKRIQMSGFSHRESKTDFLLLKPKMAYAAKRATDKDKSATGASDFEKVMKLAHGEVADNETRFENFCDFIEAILAYHKAAGGRD